MSYNIQLPNDTRIYQCHYEPSLKQIVFDGPSEGNLLPIQVYPGQSVSGAIIAAHPNAIVWL